jgi:putative addiction module killer protein
MAAASQGPACESLDFVPPESPGLRHMGDVGSVGQGISELRIHYGPGYRVYFQKRENMIVVLLCGGDKGTQARDISPAKQLAAEWSEAND